MKQYFIFALLIATSAAAQQQSANSLPGVRRPDPPRPTGPTPHLADGTVDLWGVWYGGGPTGNIAQGLPKGEKLPLLPSAEKILKSRQSKDDPETNCLPAGVPRMAPYPWRIVQTPTHIFFLYEGNIHSDGAHTYCPKCAELLVRRSWHDVLQNRLNAGACPECGFQIAGVWSNDAKGNRAPGYGTSRPARYRHLNL